jgi:predicted MFS family arabinose efflux permease
LSDKIGCGRSLIVAFALQCAALLMMPLVNNLGGSCLAGRSILWVQRSAEREPCARHGESAGTKARPGHGEFYRGLSLSNGVGALLNGLVVDLAGYA